MIKIQHKGGFQMNAFFAKASALNDFESFKPAPLSFDL